MSLPDFQVRRHTKAIPVDTHISSAQRPAPLRTRFTNRLNPEDNKGVRNVPLPQQRISNNNNNKAVIDRRLRPRCCHLWSYFKLVISMPLYTQGDYVQTWCHDYSTRSLRPSRPRPRRPKSRPVSVSPLARNGYSYAPFIAKSKAACGLCFDQLGGHVELPWLVRKYDVIHKNGST